MLHKTVLIATMLLTSTLGAQKVSIDGKPLLFTEKQTVVIEGDSHSDRKLGPALDTSAYLRLNNWDISWADRFEEWIFCNRPDLALTIRCSAVGGSTVGTMLERYEERVKPLKPDWVIVSAGNNDIGRENAETFAKNLNEYCKRVKDDSGGRVIFVSLINHNKHGREFEEWPQWQDAITKTMKKYNGLYLDISEEIHSKEMQLKEQWRHYTIGTHQDNHFNAVGAEIISSLMLQECGLMIVPGW